MDKCSQVEFPEIYTDPNLQAEMKRLFVTEYALEVESSVWPVRGRVVNERLKHSGRAILRRQESWQQEALGLAEEELWRKEASVLLEHEERKSEVLVVEQQRSSNVETTKFYCVLCKNNGEPTVKYMSHNLKDKWNRVTCPVLFALTCKHCGATGSNSHTAAYCPKLRRTYIENACDRPPVVGTMLKQTKRNSTGCRRQSNHK